MKRNSVISVLLKLFFTGAGLAILAILLAFNPLSHLHFWLDSDNPLAPLQDMRRTRIHESEMVVIEAVRMERADQRWHQRMLYRLSPPTVHVFRFRNLPGAFSLVHEADGGTTSRRVVRQGHVFAINSSFFDQETRSIGEVIVNGVRHGQASASSGFFKVINGKAYAGPRSLFATIRGTVSHSCQAHPSVMRDGTIWGYILDENRSPREWKRRTYRNLCGMDANGDIVIVVSGNGGLLSVREVSLLARQLGVRTATLFDAGSALQYSFQHDGFDLHFSAGNNRIAPGSWLGGTLSRVIGRKAFTTSPVFIAYRIDHTDSSALSQSCSRAAPQCFRYRRINGGTPQRIRAPLQTCRHDANPVAHVQMHRPGKQAGRAQLQLVGEGRPGSAQKPQLRTI